MSSQTRNYSVAGLVFSVGLCDPWNFIEYTAPVQERIDRARRGELIPVLPTRAGDPVPSRTFITCREEVPSMASHSTLDFSQYEPFRAGDDTPADFLFFVHPESDRNIDEAKREQKAELLMDVRGSISPAYSIYRLDGKIIFELEDFQSKVAAILEISDDYRRGDFYPRPGYKRMTIQSNMNMALMLLYTFNAARNNALMIHASVILHQGKANLFLGHSGTGKSTHSRLWLNHVEGAQLINDDNPVLKVEEGEIIVYGTPWSGKTPCYRNTKASVRSIVSLEQAPLNRASRQRPMELFCSILTASSSIRWDDEIMEDITDTVSAVAGNVLGLKMECLPDADAAMVCMNAVLES